VKFALSGTSQSRVHSWCAVFELPVWRLACQLEFFQFTVVGGNRCDRHQWQADSAISKNKI
jgi:hypothetical protein